MRKKKSGVLLWAFHVFMFVVFSLMYHFIFGAPNWAALMGASIVTAVGEFSEQ